MTPLNRMRRHIVRSLLSYALLFGTWLSWTTSAEAQPFGKVVVVPYGSPDPRAALAAADALEAELGRRRSAVVSMHDARDRFTAQSRSPLTASKSDLDVLAAQANEAIQHVAFGRTAAAQRSVQEVILRAERTLESLNRETARARQILDACLALVRGALHDKKRDDALEQAMRCRRLVPDLAPSEQAHPANVVGVLAEADDLLRRMRTGKLSVTSQPDTSCSVYLNGRHLGTTPFVLDRAASGEYRVQVECASTPAGRVHAVQLGDQPAQLLVDTQFDAAVISDPRLALQYGSEQELRALSVSHAVQLGREVLAEDVVLVRVVGERAELTRVRVQQGRVAARAQAVYRAGFDAAGLSDVVAALLEGRSADPMTSDVAPVAAPTTPDIVRPTADVETHDALPAETTRPTKRTPPGRWQRPVAYVLAGVSAGLWTAGLILDLKAQSLKDDLVGSADTQTVGSSQRFDRFSSARWMGVAAAPLGIASAALWISPRQDVPWWSYMLGAAGVASASYGVYELATAGQCSLKGNGQCLRDKDTHARGALLLSAAAPLLSVPVVHLLKRTQALHAADVEATPTDGGAYLSLRATY